MSLTITTEFSPIGEQSMSQSETDKRNAEEARRIVANELKATQPRVHARPYLPPFFSWLYSDAEKRAMEQSFLTDPGVPLSDFLGKTLKVNRYAITGAVLLATDSLKRIECVMLTLIASGEQRYYTNDMLAINTFLQLRTKGMQFNGGIYNLLRADSFNIEDGTCGIVVSEADPERQFA